MEVVEYDHVAHPEDFLPRGWYYYASQFFGLVKRKIQRRETQALLEASIASYKQEIDLRDKRFEEMYGKMLYTKPVNTDEDFRRLNEEFDAFIVEVIKFGIPVCLIVVIFWIMCLRVR